MFSNALKEAYRNKNNTIKCSKIENDILSQSNMTSTHLLLIENFPQREIGQRKKRSIYIGQCIRIAKKEKSLQNLLFQAIGRMWQH